MLVARHTLAWQGVGLDVEPEARVFEQIMSAPWGLARMRSAVPGQTEQAERGHTLYGRLVDPMRSDGYRVENYPFPLMADERWAGSTLLQRLLGLADVRTDREVWMLYTSFMRNHWPVHAVDVQTGGAGDRRRHNRRWSGYSRPSPDASSELGRAGA